MKPAVDEMFPEGAGPYVDLDEVGLSIWTEIVNIIVKKKKKKKANNSWLTLTSSVTLEP